MSIWSSRDFGSLPAAGLRRRVRRISLRCSVVLNNAAVEMFIFLLDGDEEEGVMDVDLSSAPSRRYASPGGFGLMPLVFLSLLSIFGSCACGVATAGAASVRFVYSYLEKSGWNSCTTSSGGFFSLLGLLSSSEPGLLVIETPDPLFTGEMMAFGHLDWPVRSVIKRHVGLPDVLLMVPLKLSAVLRRYGGRLHGRQLRSSATRQTGSILQGRGCILYFFQSCLCKFGNVSYQKFK